MSHMMAGHADSHLYRNIRGRRVNSKINCRGGYDGDLEGGGWQTIAQRCTETQPPRNWTAKATSE